MGDRGILSFSSFFFFFQKKKEKGNKKSGVLYCTSLSVK